MKNKYLELVPTEKLVRPGCQGVINANLIRSTGVFDHIDPDIMHYKIDSEQPATEETEVKIYKMSGEDADYYTLFESLKKNLNDVSFKSQEQIISFVSNYTKELYEFGNLFLFKENKKFYVANVDIAVGKLWLNVYPLTATRKKLLADIKYQVIVPIKKFY